MALLAAIALGAPALGAPALGAQVADSARVGASAPRDTVADTSFAARSARHRPPISSKRALLQSLAIPGWGQASLHRSTAGAIFAALELTSIAMLVQSKSELHAARAAARDSVFDSGSGAYVANPLASQVAPRRQAVEDWTALLIFTHLFAGADAFVAAQLWDVPVEVGGHRLSRGATVSARFRF